jgi:hypothetical protein
LILKKILTDLLAGTHINDVAKSLCKIANQNFAVAEASFNGYQIKASPFSSPSEIVKKYKAFCYHETERYKKSPEGIAAQKRQELKHQAALSAKPRMFSVRTVLTVTTGRLLTTPKSASDNGIDDLYQIIDHALATSVSTLGLPRASEVLKPKILEQYPELSVTSENLGLLDSLLQTKASQIAIEFWIESLCLASKYEIPVYAEEIS